MTLSSLLIFIPVYALAVLSPGPGVAAVVARTLSRGPRDTQQHSPISLFEAELKQFGVMDDAAIAQLREAVDAEIAAGIAFAKESPAPSSAEALDFVYTEQQ